MLDTIMGQLQQHSALVRSVMQGSGCLSRRRPIQRARTRGGTDGAIKPMQRLAKGSAVEITPNNPSKYARGAITGQQHGCSGIGGSHLSVAKKAGGRPSIQSKDGVFLTRSSVPFVAFCTCASRNGALCKQFAGFA
jgi:hypothetical protein